MDALYYCNIDADEELNKRISQRNIPSSPLQPQFTFRPISTKYSFLPIVDHRAPAKVPIIRRPAYNSECVFNPGTAQSPWSGFATNINKESDLRNQFFGLQKCEQSQYVPSTDSDMYKSYVVGRNESQPFPGLFTQEKFNKFNPNDCDVGKDIFNNSTRVQLLSSECCKKIC
jgi:hypothetical protein